MKQQLNLLSTSLLLEIAADLAEKRHFGMQLYAETCAVLAARTGKDAAQALVRIRMYDHLMETTDLDDIEHHGLPVADKILCWGHLLVYGEIRRTDPLEHIPGDEQECPDCPHFENCPACRRNE